MDTTTNRVQGPLENREHARRRVLSRGACGLLGIYTCTLLLSACATNPAASPAATPQPARQSPTALATQPEPSVAANSLEPAIQRMVAPQPGGAPLRILSVAGPVRGWLAVAVSPPYREFPTVVLFRSGQNGSWNRVFEGLIPGVQPQRSGLLDLHTKGKAFDYTIGEGEPITADTVTKVLALSTSKKLVTVAHAYFFHGHETGEESYFVDRTATYELARRLFPGEYEKYPRVECTMFDVPAIRQINLASTGDRWVLTAQTENGQRWTISWNGVDDRGLLTSKTVDAR